MGTVYLTADLLVLSGVVECGVEDTEYGLWPTVRGSGVCVGQVTPTLPQVPLGLGLFLLMEIFLAYNVDYLVLGVQHNDLLHIYIYTLHNDYHMFN